MNFKFIYEGLTKKIIFSFLTVIQFIIALICIFMSIQSINNINRSINDINKYFDDGKYYKMDDSLSQNSLNISDENSISEDIDTLMTIKTYLENNKNIKFLSINSNEVLLRKEEALADTIVIYDPVTFENTDYIRTQGFCANKNFLERMNYSLIDGDIKDFERVNGKYYVPIILGNIYKDKYKVGDTIESLDLLADSEPVKSTLKVIGILDDNNYVYENGISTQKQSLNNVIIYPYNEEILFKNKSNEKLSGIIKGNLVNYLSSGYVLLNNNESIENINKDLLNFKFKFQLEDLTESMNEFKNEIKDTVKPVTYTAIIVILFSIISVIIVMINSINKEKKDFGINIMVGATMNNIKIRVLGQVFSLLGISIVVSAIILKYFSIFGFNIIDFILTIIIMVIALTIISTILIFTLNKYSINDLIRRID